MVQPPGFESQDPSLVCKLNKALYGLKQASRAWYERLTAALIQFGFAASKCHPSLFTYASKATCLHVLVYVDDIETSSQLIHDLISKFFTLNLLSNSLAPWITSLELKFRG